MFENRLLPLIRNEQGREDYVRTFAAARDRAHKHVLNNLHSVHTTHLSSAISTPAPKLKNQLETHLDDIQATIASPVEAPKHHRRDHSKMERRATYGHQENNPAPTSVPRNDKNIRKGKSTRMTRPNTSTHMDTVCDLLRIK